MLPALPRLALAGAIALASVVLGAPHPALAQSGPADGDRAVWGSARYDEEYVRVNGQWKFQNLTLTSHFWTPFDGKGWVETKFA